MKAMTLICTPTNPIQTRLLLLLQANCVSYRVECWSFRWWFCPNCLCRLPSHGSVANYRCCCSVCNLQVDCEKRDPGMYVAISPVVENPAPAG